MTTAVPGPRPPDTDDDAGRRRFIDACETTWDRSRAAGRRSLHQWATAVHQSLGGRLIVTNADPDVRRSVPESVYITAAFNGVLAPDLDTGYRRVH